MSDETQSLEELVSFLSHPRPEVRKSASSLLVQLTASDAGIHQLLNVRNWDAVKGLCRMVSDLRPVAEDAIKALINLTAANPVAGERALQFDVISRVLNQTQDPEWQLKDLSMMLLANTTTVADGCRILLGTDEKSDASESAEVREYKMRTLTNHFLATEPEPEGADERTGEPKWDDEYQYVANILSNITQVEEGRAFLLRQHGTERKTLVAELVAQMRSPNVVRRRGVLAAIRNLCFNSENHFYLYDQLDIVTQLQYLLAGPEPLEEDEKDGMDPSIYRLGGKKKREIDAEVRKAAVDSLLLLCTTRSGRTNLRRKKVYPIIRNAHLVESDEEIGENIYKLVDLLIRDEEGEGPDWDSIRSEAFADDGQTSGATTPAPSTASTSTSTPPPAAQTTSAAAVASTTAASTEEPITEISTGEEVVSDEAASKLAKEMDLLDVSSDEEELEDPDVD